jgi:hypothetical protein
MLHALPRAGPPIPSSTLPKKSARKKSRLNSNGLGAIKALAHNLFHKICEEYRQPSNDVGTVPSRSVRGSGCVTEGRDYTAAPPWRRQGPFGATLCAQARFA